jgi:hypothetical protein
VAEIGQLNLKESTLSGLCIKPKELLLDGFPAQLINPRLLCTYQIWNRFLILIQLGKQLIYLFQGRIVID